MVGSYDGNATALGEVLLALCLADLDLLFFAAACLISATAELTGTKTGWPFGGYEYTDFLGAKLLGRVPFPIPLSWFYMGFASLLLADSIAAARGWNNHRTLRSILLGAYLLTAWDLVLDPSMAAPQLQYIHFWIWHEHGPYFGMPLRNLIGWFGTGLAFIAAGRLAWRDRIAPAAPASLPFTVYAVNVLWSMVLSVSAGMWPTAIAAIVLSLAPAALAVLPPNVARITHEPVATASFMDLRAASKPLIFVSDAADGVAGVGSRWQGDWQCDFQSAGARGDFCEPWVDGV